MSTTALSILFPVGRVVMGSMHEAQTKDANGAPLTIKTPGHPDFGKPTQRFFFAIAIPKNPGEQHWAQTVWGQKIWAHGHAAWPNGQGNAPTFAWKVEDGDSTVPNKRGRKNASTDGMPGHWIVNFSSSFAVKTFDAKGTMAVDPKSIKLGHYVEVFGTIDSNKNAQNPGIYINHSMVAHAGFGPEISRGPDPGAVGFGKGALPAGASATPPPSMQAPAPAVPGSAPPVPGAPPAPVPAPVAPPAPVQTAVAPHAGYMAPPIPGSAPAAPPPPAAAPTTPPPPAAPVWRGPAGTTREQYAQAGWTDVHMRNAGYIV